MNRPGSKSLLQRIVKKALSSARFGLGHNSPEHHAPKMPKTISCEDRGGIPKGSRTPHHSSHWHVVAPKSQPNHERRDNQDAAVIKPPQPCRNNAATLSIPTYQYSIDAPPSEAFSLDEFIRENESWTPPSPREVLSRQQFREARQASNMPPQIPIDYSPGGYLVRRPLKS